MGGKWGKKTILLYFKNRKQTEIQHELLSIKRYSLPSLAVHFYLQKAQISLNWMLYIKGVISKGNVLAVLFLMERDKILQLPC